MQKMQNPRHGGFILYKNKALHLLQSLDGRLNYDSQCDVACPDTSIKSFHAGLKVPEANNLFLHPSLATEGAGVLAVLADLNLFHHLPERGTITGTIFHNNSHLLGALGLFIHVMDEHKTFSARQI